jgi:hypothetical protein
MPSWWGRDSEGVKNALPTLPTLSEAPLSRSLSGSSSVAVSTELATRSTTKENTRLSWCLSATLFSITICFILLAPTVRATEGVDDDSASGWVENGALPHGRWDYGRYANAAAWQTFTRLGSPNQYSSWIGGTAKRWAGNGPPSGYPAVSQFAICPGHDEWAVRRWTSDTNAVIEIEYDAKRIQNGGSGQAVGVYHNGTELWRGQLRNADLHEAGILIVTVTAGDVIDFIADSEGQNSSDWTYYRSRIRMTHRRPVPSSGLALHYTLDEDSEASSSSTPDAPFSRVLTCGDRSGANHHAYMYNMAANDHVRGRIGNALKFDGADDYAITLDSDIANGATELTLSAWIRPDDKDRWDGILTSKSNAGNAFTGVALADYGVGFDSPTFRVMNAGNVSSTIDTPVRTWSHVVCVWKSGEQHRIYVNGRLGAENDADAYDGAVEMTEPWHVGADRLIGGRYFDGLIDDVTIWTRALSESEIVELYRLGIHGWDASYLGNAPQGLGHLPCATGLKVWLDAQDVNGRRNATLVHGDVLLEWFNRAGGLAGDATTGLGAIRIGLYSAGTGPMGMNAVRLDGSDLDSLRFGEFMTRPTCSVYAVAKNTGGNGTRPVFWDAHADGGGEISFSTTASGAWVRDGDGDTLSVPHAGQLFLHDWDCGVMILSDDGGQYRLEAGLVDRTAAATGASYDATTWEGTFRAPHVGKRPDATNLDSFGGELAEILVYDHALSPSDRAAVRRYITDKYFNMPDGLGITIR